MKLYVLTVATCRSFFSLSACHIVHSACQFCPGACRYACNRACNSLHHYLTVTASVQLEPAEEDASVASVPMVNVNPSKISLVETAEVNSFVDVIAVLDNCNDLGMITRRDGSEAPKRSLVIRDDSLKSVEVTLWGDKAQGIGATLFDKFRAGDHPVLVIKGTLLWLRMEVYWFMLLHVLRCVRHLAV